MQGATIAIFCALTGTFATAAWAIVLRNAPSPLDTVRCSLIVAGMIAAATVPFKPIAVDARAVLPGFILVLYQVLLGYAFAERPIATQAIINCNVVILVGWIAIKESQQQPISMWPACIALIASAATVVALSMSAEKGTGD